MSDIWTATRCGYAAIDPDDAPSASDAFADCLREIWEQATGQQRVAISHERYELGIRDKAIRDYTTTEQAVQDEIYAAIMAEAAREREREAQWAAEDAARQQIEEANWADERAEWARDADLPF